LKGFIVDKKIDKVTPLDLLNNKNYTTSEVRDERYSMCLECPELISITRTCKKCGCFMSLKTWIKNASCPIGKWQETDL
jgi:hypothetical protein